MSANHSVGRITPTPGEKTSVVKSKKDRSPNLCTFTFADGRQCRTPRCSGHLHLCYFHAQKEAESLAAQQVGQDISRFLPAKLLTACDLGVAMSRLFCAVAQGKVKPKVASTLAYLAQTMLQSIPIAQHEYCEALGTDYWEGAIRSSFKVPAQEPEPEPKPQPLKSMPAPTPKPTPQPPQLIPQPAQPASPPASSASAPSAKPAPSPAPQPAPSPHTPLPRTSAEFAQQLLAGRNSSPSETPTPSASEIPALSGPARDPRSLGSPSSSTPSSASSPSDSTPARTSSTQPAPSSPTAPPTPNNSQPAPAPSAPPPVPPGFGAPANWDVLIPPKPRRRFSRHWHLLE